MYSPTVSLEDVVLPKELKDTILKETGNFAAYRAYRQAKKLDDFGSLRRGLVLMFCGPSGTGKTLTANAIATSMNKKMLLVNFPMLNASNGDKKSGQTIRSLFREAELNDAVIFFDECESLFAKRTSGNNSNKLTTLLIEIERFEGIIFMATNRPFDLDEAMCVSGMQDSVCRARYSVYIVGELGVDRIIPVEPCCAEDHLLFL